MDETACLYCQQRIVRINYALGPRWMHQRKGGSFQDDVHEFCRLSRATPRSSDGSADR